MRARRRLSALAVLGLSFGALAGVAGANHSQYEQISSGEINGNGAFDATFGGASTDGTRVFFQTYEQLVPGDTDTVQDIYKRSGGNTTRVSVGQINGNGAANAFFAGNSADGNRLFFVTNERLVSGDTDAFQDIYERSGGTTTRVSAGQTNGNGGFDATLRGASADGTRVFFETKEKLVSADTDAVQDVYERSGGTTKRVSAGPINGNGAFDAFFRGASADGTRVFFATAEKLVSGDTDSSTDIYQRSGGTTTRVSAGQINGNGAFDATYGGASTDGSSVFFQTAEKLVSADTDSSTDIYQRSGGTTTRVSAGQVNGNGAFGAFFARASADGTRVFFLTNEQLVSGDTDAFQDIYERSGGTTSRISRGNGAFTASFSRASADGSAVFFTTNENVIVDDVDGYADVYGAYIAP